MDQFNEVTHVIFDCDGLLVDSEQYYHQALCEEAAKHGKEFNYDIKCRMMGTTPLEGVQICLEELGLAGEVEPEEFLAGYEETLKGYADQIQLMPGAQRLIEHLMSHSIPMAMATGSSEESFEIKTGHIGDILRTPFSHHVFAGSDPDVARGKPYPDVFIAAAERFEDPPRSSQSVLVFEDSVNGVRAAQAADMQVVFVPDKCYDPSNVDVTPTATITSLDDFAPEEFGLPPYDN